jgi:hypothetical protein
LTPSFGCRIAIGMAAQRKAEGVAPLDIIKGSSQSATTAQLAQAFGIDPNAAEQVAKSISGQLAERMERNSFSRGGIADLVAAMAEAQRAPALDDTKALVSPAVVQSGNAILEQILWSKDKSRAVAARAAASSGVSEDLVKKMLPVIATMMMGGLAKQSGGALGQIMQQVQKFGGSEQGGEMLPLPGQRPSRGTTGDFGHRPGGGSPPQGGGMPQFPGGSGGQSPLPLPGDNFPSGGSMGGGRNPLDDLSDILRRGGFNLPGGGGTPMPRQQPGGGGLDLPGGVGAGGGALWNIIRGILGAALGFQSRGIMGWIIRMIVMRWGWGFLQRILGRVLLGR